MAEQVYIEKVYEFPNAIVTVRKPVLTEEEYKKRLKRVHDAAASLIRSKYGSLGG